MGKELRPYQIAAKEAVMNGLENGISKPIVVLPTGTGKTFTAAQIAEEFDRVLWITHTEELIDQSALALIMNISKDPLKAEKIIDDINGMFEFLNYADNNSARLSKEEEFINNTCGIIKATRMDIDKKITIASIQTIHRRLDKLQPNTFDIIIVDECHMAGAITWNKTIEHFSEAKLVLGLTATPYRTDGTSLGSIFDEIVYDYKINQAIKDGYLCEIDAIRIRTNVSLDKVRTTAGELNQKDLDNYVNCPERNNLIVDSYEKYAYGKQGIIFCVNVQHALDVHATFLNRGHNRVDFVVGDKKLCPDRKERIRGFKKGRIDTIVNVMVLTTGFDHPNVGWVGMACPTKSLVKYIQCIGRGTRLKDEKYVEKFKQQVTILDFVDVTTRHRLINTWELDREKEHEDKVFVTTEKRDKIIEARRVRLESLTSKDEKVKLLALPKARISKSGKMKEAATYKQLMFLKGLGYDVVNNFYSKYDASEIISNEPASLAQIYRLKKEGYNIKNGVTRGEAQLAFIEVEERKQGLIELAKIKRNQALRAAKENDNSNKRFI